MRTVLRKQQKNCSSDTIRSTPIRYF